MADPSTTKTEMQILRAGRHNLQPADRTGSRTCCSTSDWCGTAPTLAKSTIGAEGHGMGSDAERLDQLVEELRSLRNRTCEPKSNANQRYLRLSNAVSALLWVADDLRREDGADA
jgi:hypothetical protein